MGTKFRFRIADSAEECEAIHRLDDRTFVEEIPQHRANPERRIGEVRLLAIPLNPSYRVRHTADGTMH
jgi:hypothetical protein